MKPSKVLSGYWNVVTSHSVLYSAAGSRTCIEFVILGLTVLYFNSIPRL